MPIRLLTDEQRLNGQRATFAASLTRLGRTLAGTPSLRVRLFKEGEWGAQQGTPAFTMMYEVNDWRRNYYGIGAATPKRKTFDMYLSAKDAMKTASIEDRAAGMGLFHHELSHVNYTPMSDIVRKHIPDHQFPTFNMVEDHRIERLSIAVYPAVRPYLMRVVDVFLQTPEGQPGHVSRYLLLAGRKYIPQETREAARADFVKAVDEKHPGEGEQVTNTVERLIGNYLLLVLPDQMTEAAKIVDELYKLLKDKAPEGGAPEDQKSTHENGAPCQGGAGRGQSKAQRAAQRAAARAEGQDPGEGEEDGEDGDEGEDGDSPSQGGKKGDKSKGTGKTAGDTSDADVWDHVRDVNGVDATETGYGEGGTSGYEEFGLDKSAVAAIRALDDEKVETLTPEEFVEADVEAVLASTAYAKTVKKIVAHVEPGWNHRTPAGRINIQRAMDGGTELSELFDQWDEGRIEDTRVETVLLVDCSGSMSGGAMNDALASAWAVKRAGDEIGHPVTVILYNTEHAILWSPRHKVSRNQRAHLDANGGTDPLHALIAAALIFERSPLRHKVLITMTDGEWNHQTESQCSGVVQRMNKADVVTALYQYTSDWDGGNNNHGHTIMRSSSKMSDLSDLAKDLVGQLAKKGASRR